MRVGRLANVTLESWPQIHDIALREKMNGSDDEVSLLRTGVQTPFAIRLVQLAMAGRNSLLPSTKVPRTIPL